jgi:hypothetical protein
MVPAAAMTAISMSGNRGRLTPWTGCHRSIAGWSSGACCGSCSRTSSFGLSSTRWEYRNRGHPWSSRLSWLPYSFPWSGDQRSQRPGHRCRSSGEGVPIAVEMHPRMPMPSSTPPAGISGAIRKFAYKYSEGRAAHWLLLIASDRVDAWEHHLSSFASLHPDNPVTEIRLTAAADTVRPASASSVTAPVSASVPAPAPAPRPRPARPGRCRQR